MNPAELAAALLDVVRATAAAPRGRRRAEITPEDVTLERPRNRDHGDWASNVALKLGKRLGLDPREFATEIADGARRGRRHRLRRGRRAGLPQHPAGCRGGRRCSRSRSSRQGDSYGHGALYDGVTINVEFVSANPTGPLHIGGTRWAAVGDSLARIFKAQGGDRHARVLLQRPRHPDRPVRAQPGRRAPR